MKVPQCLYGCKPAQMTEKQPSVQLALLPGVSVESNTCPYPPPKTYSTSTSSWIHIIAR